MPIYAYRCEACGHEHDALQKLSDPPLTDCPACGAPALKKQLTAAAFRLKGAGWYETDFKKDGKRNLHEGGDAAPAATTDGANDKADGKPGETKPAETKPSEAGAAKQPADTPATKSAATTAPAPKPAGGSPPKAAAN